MLFDEEKADASPVKSSYPNGFRASAPIAAIGNRDTLKVNPVSLGSAFNLCVASDAVRPERVIGGRDGSTTCPASLSRYGLPARRCARRSSSRVLVASGNSTGGWLGVILRGVSSTAMRTVDCGPILDGPRRA